MKRLDREGIGLLPPTPRLAEARRSAERPAAHVARGRLGRGLVVLMGLVLLGCATPSGPAVVPATAGPVPAAAPGRQSVAPGAAATATIIAPEPTRTTLKFGGQLSLSDAGIFLALERGYLAEIGVDLD